MEQTAIVVLLSLAVIAWPILGLRKALRCHKRKAQQQDEEISDLDPSVEASR